MPVGQAFPERRVTVVGVVAHLRLRSLVEDLTPQIFIPFRVWQRNPMAFVVRTGGDQAAVTTAISAAVARFDPRVPIYDVREMSTYLDDARAVRRFTMVLTAVFALSAVALTCIGVYGVLVHETGSSPLLLSGCYRSSRFSFPKQFLKTPLDISLDRA